MFSAMNTPSGISIEDDEGEEQVAPERAPETVRCQHFLEPVGAGPEELVVAEGVLHRIVDDRHQRDDGREGHQMKAGSTMNQALLFQVFSMISPPCPHATSRRRC
jgi:hypothetical protein